MGAIEGYAQLALTHSVKWPTINYQYSQIEKDLPSQRNNARIGFKLNWYQSLHLFPKLPSELNHCRISISRKPLSSERKKKKNAVTIEEKIRNKKGKSHFPCMKSHSNFWNGSGIVSNSPWGAWNRDEVLVPTKHELPPSYEDIFSKPNFRTYAFDGQNGVCEAGAIPGLMNNQDFWFTQQIALSGWWSKRCPWCYIWKIQ